MSTPRIEFSDFVAAKRWLQFYRALYLEDRRKFFDLGKMKKAYRRARGGQYGDRMNFGLYVKGYFSHRVAPFSMKPFMTRLYWYARHVGVSVNAPGFPVATLAVVETILDQFVWTNGGRMSFSGRKPKDPEDNFDGGNVLQWIGGYLVHQKIEDDADLFMYKAGELLSKYLNVDGRAYFGTAAHLVPEPPQMPRYIFGAGGTRQDYYDVVIKIASRYADEVEQSYIENEEATNLSKTVEKRQTDHYRWLIMRMNGESPAQIAEKIEEQHGVLDVSTITKAIKTVASDLGIQLKPLPRGRPKSERS